MPFLAQASECKPDQTQEIIQISGFYNFHTPSWWQETAVEIKNEYKDLANLEKRKLMSKLFPRKDIDSTDYWKERLKFLALTNAYGETTPSYLAHEYAQGKDFCTSNSIFISLYNDYGINKNAFSSVYIPYVIVRNSLALNDKASAKKWQNIGITAWENLAESEKSDKSIRHYYELLQEYDF